MSQRRLERLRPGQIPSEVLGQIYAHVDHPAEFGAVNSAFKGVQTDPHFEKARLQRLVEDAIRKNNGRVFDEMPWRRNEMTSQQNEMINKLFFNEFRCVLIIVDLRRDNVYLTATFSRNIKKVTFKAIVGLESFSNVPQFVPVGRFDLLTHHPFPLDYGKIDAHRHELVRSLHEKLVQNNPMLKRDLLLALRTDLQNPCTGFVIRNSRETLDEYLSTLSLLEQDDKTVIDVIAEMRLRIRRPSYRKENVTVVEDTLEISICFAYDYEIRGAIE